MNPPTILSVDDSEDDSMLLQQACRKHSAAFSLHILSHGQETIDYLSGNDCYADRRRFPLPSLLLLDLKMPRKNGFEVLEWIAQQHALPDLAIAVFTASQDETDIKRAYEKGAKWYLMKPVHFRDLAGLVRSLNHWLATREDDCLAALPFYRAPVRS
jgi:CheY-like chemotaxis protein